MPPPRAVSMMTRGCLIGLLIAALLVGGCAAIPAALPSATPTPSPPDDTTVGNVTFMLDLSSTQKMTVAVSTPAFDTVLEGVSDKGVPLVGALLPGDYQYRAAQIFEPLEPTPCYQSVQEGTFTIAAGDALTITLFNGEVPECGE